MDQVYGVSTTYFKEGEGARTRGVMGQQKMSWVKQKPGGGGRWFAAQGRIFHLDCAILKCAERFLVNSMKKLVTGLC